MAMRSFRLYRKPTPTRPEREVTAIPPEERAALRAAFAPIARRRRRLGWEAMLAALAAFTLFFVGEAVPEPYDAWATAGGVVAVLVAFARGASLSTAEIRCPACGNDVSAGAGPFCPFCGRRAVRPGRWFRQARCAACREPVDGSHEEGRPSGVRACTHCGLWLDDKGL